MDQWRHNHQLEQDFIMEIQTRSCSDVYDAEPKREAEAFTIRSGLLSAHQRGWGNTIMLLRCPHLGAQCFGGSGRGETAGNFILDGTDDHTGDENKVNRGNREKREGYSTMLIQLAVAWWSDAFVGWEDTGGGQKIDLHLINVERKDARTNSRMTDSQKRKMEILIWKRFHWLDKINQRLLQRWSRSNGRSSYCIWSQKRKVKAKLHIMHLKAHNVKLWWKYSS